MERKVLVDRRLAAPDGVLDAPVSLGDLFDVRAIVALGREPRRFDLDAGAQLHDVERFAQRIQLVDFDAERPAHVFGDEGADALPHHDQTVGAQARHRLAHHGAAHPGRGHHLLLGRQFRAGRQAAAGDVGADARDQLLGEPARRHERPECRQRLRYGTGRQSLTLLADLVIV